MHLRDAQARHPTGHAAYLSHVSQAARRPGGRRTATAAAGEAGGLKTHHEMSGPVQRCRPQVTRDVLRHAWRWKTRGDTRFHIPRLTRVGREGAASPYFTCGVIDAAIQEPSLGTSRTSRAYGWTLLTGWSGSGIWEGVYEGGTPSPCDGKWSRGAIGFTTRCPHGGGARGRRGVDFHQRRPRCTTRQAVVQPACHATLGFRAAGGPYRARVGRATPPPDWHCESICPPA